MQKPVNNLVTIVTVNYNSTLFLNKLLASLTNINDIIYEVIIIDNNSTDFYRLKKPVPLNCKIIRNRDNIGFSRAVNQGALETKSEYILLLNPDSFVTDDSIKILHKQIKENEEIGIIGGRILSNNQKFSATSTPNFLTGLFEFTILKKLFPNNIFSKNFWIESKSITHPIEVVSICGAFLMYRKYMNRNIAMFDERYFLYLEDLDFGIATRSKGYKVIFDPRAQVIHIGGMSSNNRHNIVLKHWYNSRRYFFRKHLDRLLGIILDTIFALEQTLLETRELLSTKN
jgi:GT2 family glycosyltransferase